MHICHLKITTSDLFINYTHTPVSNTRHNIMKIVYI